MFKKIDNFINKEEHLIIKNVLESNNFPWYFSKQSVTGTKNKFDCHFGHNFYLNDNITSDYFKLLNPIIKQLKVNSLIRIKGNLTLGTNKQIESTPHIDQTFDCKVALYYMGTNNGSTIIEKKKIKSIENRIVLFNSDVIHTSTMCTDTPTRITINFNYV
tara:strand:+ start:31 stop:510 length:480 start_codon:yes stop_codon:yes gene_type:complete